MIYCNRSNFHARNSNANARFSVIPGQSGSSVAGAGPSAPRLSFAARPPPTAVSSAVLASPWASNAWLAGADLSESVKDGKRKAKEEVEEEWHGTRVEIGNRLQLERELIEVQCEARLCREEERRFREKAETAEARGKWLQQQLKSLNIE